jgi:site-specific recombinase XerC
VADRLAWLKALTSGDILDDDVSPAARWRQVTRMKYQQGYGLWLSFILERGEANQPPAARVTREAVRAYIDVLKPLMASGSVWAQLGNLLAVAKAIAPSEDWSWLKVVVARLLSQRVAKKNKLGTLRPAHEIAAAAFTEMDRLQQQHDRSQRCLLDYRNSLMMALLICCPILRRKNLVSIRIGRHLQALPDRFRLSFSADEVKGGRPVDVILPEDLVIYMTHYLEEWRPLLQPDPTEDALWIGKDGEPLKELQTYLNFRNLTKRLLGQAINPHLFRDCAATFVAMEDPHHIGVASQILGHADLKTTEQYYIQANMLHAGRRLRTSIASLKESYPPTRRHSGKAVVQ